MVFGGFSSRFCLIFVIFLKCIEKKLNKFVWKVQQKRCTYVKTNKNHYVIRYCGLMIAFKVSVAQAERRIDCNACGIQFWLVIAYFVLLRFQTSSYKSSSKYRCCISPFELNPQKSDRFGYTINTNLRLWNLWKLGLFIYYVQKKFDM